MQVINADRYFDNEIFPYQYNWKITIQRFDLSCDVLRWIFWKVACLVSTIISNVPWNCAWSRWPLGLILSGKNAVRNYWYICVEEQLPYIAPVLACLSGMSSHDDVIKWIHFPRYLPFVGGIHWSPVNSPYKGQWRGALMFSLIWAWTNGLVNNRDAGDLRRHRAHMTSFNEACHPIDGGYLL